jgi:hypothetical protein
MAHEQGWPRLCLTGKYLVAFTSNTGRAHTCRCCIDCAACRPCARGSSTSARIMRDEHTTSMCFVLLQLTHTTIMHS